MSLLAAIPTVPDPWMLLSFPSRVLPLSRCVARAPHSDADASHLELWYVWYLPGPIGAQPLSGVGASSLLIALYK